jgi:hypothetical protein
MASPFSPAELAYLEAHKHDSRVTEIHWVYTVPIVAATLSTTLRFWAKRLGRNGITLDDYLILFATFCVLGQCSSGLGYGARFSILSIPRASLTRGRPSPRHGPACHHRFSL